MDKKSPYLVLSLLLLLVGYTPAVSTQVLVTIPNIDEMIVETMGEPDSVDPAWTSYTASAELIFNVYETLIRFDGEKVDEFLPSLATEWTIENISETSPEGLTWLQRYTFKIREEVEFHDGSLLTAEDVEYSFERVLVQDRLGSLMLYQPLLGVWNSNLSDPSWHLKIENAIQHNDTHAWFNLVMSYAPLLQILSQSWSSIVSKQFCIAHGCWPGTWEDWQDYHDPDVSPLDTGGDWMCGTGPYRLDYLYSGNGFGGEYLLVKFDDYWQGWPAPNCSSYVSRATVKSMLPWPVKKEMFLNGTADIIYVPRGCAEELEGVPGIRYIKDLPRLTCYAVFFNFDISTASRNIGSGLLDGEGIPPDFFSDIDVRTGFAYSINYTGYIEERYFGEATQPATPVIEGLPQRNPEQEKYYFNLTRAEHHFRVAWGGMLWENGFNMTLCYNIGAEPREQLLHQLKVNVESFNPKFNINVLGVAWPDLVEQFVGSELPLFVLGWGAEYPDPHNFVEAFMHSKGFFPLYQSYSDAVVDALVEEGLATMNSTRRYEIYYELQSIYHNSVPSVPVAQPLGRHWERDWVQGWYYNPDHPGLYFYHLWKGLDGDVNGDNHVDIVDASLISAHWSPGPPIGPLGYNRKADIAPALAYPHDGEVNILDLAAVSAHWGETCEPYP